MWKRISGILLALAILIGLLPQVAPKAKAASLEGNYYIATIRTSGNYFYMTNDLGTASTKRYTAVDSGLTTLPDSIDSPADAYVFTIVANSDGSYSIKDSSGKYLSHTSGNSGTLTDSPMSVKIEAVADNPGRYNIHFTASDAERYLALNNSSASNYFAWYKSGQKQNLVLIPVGTCSHPSSAASYTCNEDGTHVRLCESCKETVTENCTVTITEQLDANCMEYEITSYECEVCAGAWTVVGTELGNHVWVDNSCENCGLNREGYIRVDDVTTLEDGDGIVIYYPAGSLLMSATPADKKLAGVAATVTDDMVVAENGDEVFLIVRKDENDDYYFETEDGRYLTSGETGSSLSFTDALTDYSKWYFNTEGDNAALRIVNRNALFENNVIQAMEYYYGFTTYGLKDTRAYEFEIYRLANYSAHTHTWNDGDITQKPTCTEGGTNIRTCLTCGVKMTVALPVMGHEYAETDYCENCGKLCMKGQLLKELEDGDSIIIYNPASIMTLTNTPYYTYKNNYLCGMAAINCGEYVIIGAPESIIWNVEAVNENAKTYRFKTADGVYLQGTAGVDMANSASLPAAGEPDYSVWQFVDGQYLRNVGSGYTLEYYAGRWQTYNTTDYNEDYELKFFTIAAENFCEHDYEKTPLSGNSCLTDGFTLCICSICGDRYEEIILATGHKDNDLDTLCDVCGANVPNKYWEMSPTAPEAGNRYIIVAHDTEEDLWYALTTEDANAAKAPGLEVAVKDNRIYNPVEEIMFGARNHSYTSDGVPYVGLGFYDPTTDKCLHINTSKLRVTTTAQNGILEFAPGETPNTYTIHSIMNDRYLTFAEGEFASGTGEGTEFYFFYEICEHDSFYISGAYDPTCTVPGSTGTSTCAWCGKVVAEAEEIPVVDHDYEYVNNGDGTHDAVCFYCGTIEIDNEKHYYSEDSDGACICGAVQKDSYIVDSNISIGEQLFLESDLTMNFRIRESLLTAYDISTAYLVVERDIYATDGSMEIDVQTITNFTISGGRLIFVYSGIAASQMNDEIRLILYIKDAEGNQYRSDEKITSITTYAKTLLENMPTGQPKLYTVVMDMLNYGAAAQIYFNRHADAPANEAYAIFANYSKYATMELTTPLENLGRQLPNAGATAAISQALDLGTRIGITYKVYLPGTVNVAKAKLVVKDANGNELEAVNLASCGVDNRGRYLVNFYGNASRQMRRVVYATVYVDGVAVSNTYTYSISTYAYEVANTAGMPANLINLTRLMVIYGDSAAAYFG